MASYDDIKQLMREIRQAQFDDPQRIRNQPKQTQETQKGIVKGHAAIRLSKEFDNAVQTVMLDTLTKFANIAQKHGYEISREISPTVALILADELKENAQRLGAKHYEKICIATAFRGADLGDIRDDPKYALISKPAMMLLIDKSPQNFVDIMDKALDTLETFKADEDFNAKFGFFNDEKILSSILKSSKNPTGELMLVLSRREASAPREDIAPS